jgi:hypothetical protein
MQARSEVKRRSQLIKTPVIFSPCYSTFRNIFEVIGMAIGKHRFKDRQPKQIYAKSHIREQCGLGREQIPFPSYYAHGSIAKIDSTLQETLIGSYVGDIITKCSLWKKEV